MLFMMKALDLCHHLEWNNLLSSSVDSQETEGKFFPHLHLIHSTTAKKRKPFTKIFLLDKGNNKMFSGI